MHWFVRCRSLLVALALALAVVACSSGAAGAPKAEPPSPAVTHNAAAETAAAQAQAAVVLSPPGGEPVTVQIEVARTESERRRGLMFRKHLDENAGMLFLFERSEPLTFWMHNTYVPLDMIFIEPSMHVLGVVENAEPLTDSARAVPGNSQYVLEVNAGFSRRHGLGQGTAVRFEGVTASAAQGH
jgi:uncharacterized membrane protein (UPF0127 family)